MPGAMAIVTTWLAYYLTSEDGYMIVRLNGGGSKSAKGEPAAESVVKIILGELYKESGRV